MTGLRLGTNIDSLVAQNELNKATSALTKSYQRLSSGLRINEASDDAAGLAIAENLNTRKRVYSQGVRNLSDGVSILSIADGASTGLNNIVIRVRELAAQAANGTYNSQQRKAMDAEAQALARNKQ